MVGARLHRLNRVTQSHHAHAGLQLPPGHAACIFLGPDQPTNQPNQASQRASAVGTAWLLLSQQRRQRFWQHLPAKPWQRRPLKRLLLLLLLLMPLP